MLKNSQQSKSLCLEANLVCRRVLLSDSCKIFQQGPESLLQVLWECEAARYIWSSSSKSLQKFSTGQLNFIQLFEELMHRLNQNELE